MPPDSASKTTDTSHRKTWDRAEYAQKAAERETKYKEEGKARAEAKAAGKKYYKPIDPDTLHDSTSRSARLSVAQNVGKSMLVPASAGTGKRGRGAGFYCEDCDLTFKDNLQWLEHLNSKQHLVAVGQTGEVRKATLEEVRERLKLLVERRREEMREQDEPVVVGERLRLREVEDEREREEKRERRREKRRRARGGEGDGGRVKEEDDEGYGGGIIC